jgi:hypothetical protein
MKVSTYSVSVGVMARHLKALDGVIEKAIAYCVHKKVDQAAILHDRLFPDMFNFTKQVQSMCDHAKGSVARLAGVEVPAHADDEKSLEDLRARIAKTLAFITSVDRAKVEAGQDREITLKRQTGDVKMDGGTYFLSSALPNFYFHYTTAYAILRHRGLDVGKRDYLGPALEA